jgi:hypothetical protein
MISLTILRRSLAGIGARLLPGAPYAVVVYDNVEAPAARVIDLRYPCAPSFQGSFPHAG